MKLSGQKLILKISSIILLVPIIVSCSKAVPNGIYQCESDVIEFKDDNVVVRFGYVGKYDIEGEYIYLTLNGMRMPSLKLKGSDVYLNGDGTGYPDTKCTKK